MEVPAWNTWSGSNASITPASDSWTGSAYDEPSARRNGACGFGRMAKLGLFVCIPACALRHSQLTYIALLRSSQRRGRYTVHPGSQAKGCEVAAGVEARASRLESGTSPPT